MKQSTKEDLLLEILDEIISKEEALLAYSEGLLKQLENED